MQVSCYTLLSGFQLPWPPSCCIDVSTPFLGSTLAYSLAL